MFHIRALRKLMFIHKPTKYTPEGMFSALLFISPICYGYFFAHLHGVAQQKYKQFLYVGFILVV
jgi:hypothetical protein